MTIGGKCSGRTKSGKLCPNPALPQIAWCGVHSPIRRRNGKWVLPRLTDVRVKRV